MTKTAVYVLTGNADGGPNPYLDALRLSSISMHRHCPDVELCCHCDSSMFQMVQRSAKQFPDEMIHWVECPEATGGPVHRSRFIKTSLRQRIHGPFVYIDCDSIVTGSLDPLFACQQDLGLTWDAFFPEHPGEFPPWLAFHYRSLSWPIPQNYFAGGVFFAADTPATHRFFDLWHLRWHESVKRGMVEDQPPLNAALSESQPTVQLFSEMFNFLVGRQGRCLPAEARLISLLASRGPLVLPGHQALLDQLRTGQRVSDEDLDRVFRKGMPLPCEEPSAWVGFQRRLQWWNRRLGTRFGWYDATQL